MLIKTIWVDHRTWNLIQQFRVNRHDFLGGMLIHLIHADPLGCHVNPAMLILSPLEVVLPSYRDTAGASAVASRDIPRYPEAKST